VAQTKRRRQTKHRGNAAGVVESRGRTGRKPTAEEKKGDPRGTTAQKKLIDRRDRPPTWRGAFVRAMFAGVLMLGALLAFGWGSSNQVIALFPLAVIVYTPISYYTESWAYRRRKAKQAAAKQKVAK
jgi:hypothetical protein